ncbi:response regulator [Thermodesulfobacteriota bacterium]
MNKIMIADDEKAIRKFYEEELSWEGYDVVTVADPMIIMKIIAEKKPDLVILDIKMGHENGLDILQHIRNTYYNLPVILCSAYSHFKYDPRSIVADYFVVKKADLTELKLRIQMALESNNQFVDIVAAEELEGSLYHHELSNGLKDIYSGAKHPEITQEN